MQNIKTSKKIEFTYNASIEYKSEYEYNINEKYQDIYYVRLSIGWSQFCDCEKSIKVSFGNGKEIILSSQGEILKIVGDGPSGTIMLINENKK